MNTIQTVIAKRAKWHLYLGLFGCLVFVYPCAVGVSYDPSPMWYGLFKAILLFFVLPAMAYCIYQLKHQNDQVPTNVIHLKKVASFHHNLQIETEIRISVWTEHGSFGWWLPPNDPHHSIKISSINPNHGCLLALAKQLEYGFAGVDETRNWPG